MNYKKRTDGRYARQVTVGYKNGKPIKKTVYGKTQKELDTNYRNLMNLIDKNVVIDSQGMKVSELYDEWYHINIEGKIRRSTELAHLSTKKKIINEIGEMKVKNVRRYNIERAYKDLLDSGKISKAKIVLRVTKAMFEYAVANDIIVKNPCLGLSVKYKAKERRVLTENERDIIDNLKTDLKDKVFIYLLRYTGMRRGELFALHKNDIDRKNMIIHVSKTLVDNVGKPFAQDMTKTDAGDRCIPIFLKLARPLYEYLDGIDGYLFLNRNKKFMSVTSQDIYFKRVVNGIGLGGDLTMHCFRHNFVSECYAAKIDVKKVQAWVGHDDVGTTLNIYTKLSKQEIQDGSAMDIYYGSQKEVKDDFKENYIARALLN